MRVDLIHGGRRPLHMRIAMRVGRQILGFYPGPPLAISYRPDLYHPDLLGYLLRGMRGSGGWSKGDAELFSTFVSSLNSCHF